LPAARTVKNVLIYDAERARAEFGDIEMSGGRISAVTPPGASRGEVAYDGKGRCLALPGLINAHTHVSMTMLRGVGEELPLKDWLEQKVFPAEAKLGAEDIRAGADLAMIEMISSGVTGFIDMYYFMDEVADSALESGMRAALCRGLIGDDEKRIEENLSLADRYNGRDERIVVQMGPHAPYTVPRDAVKKIAAIAREKNIGVHFHWLETRGELEAFRNEFKIDPADYLAETGLLEARELVLAHSVWHPTDRLEPIARDNVTAVHNPKSNLKLGSGYAPIGEFLSGGVRVALGTDGAASNNRLDMWDEMRFAALMHKGYHEDPTLAGACDVLKMATVNGARAMGFQDVGLIKPGWRADLMIIDMNNPRYVGCDETNVPEFVVYAGSSRDVAATIVAGKTLYKDGEFTALDRGRIIAWASERRRALDGRGRV
jgi:5-methylthioadenosine/S-adenosylhomocysteine deaminase